jgi:hypothetical protein
MIYLAIGGSFLFFFTVFFLAAGILGRGWFFWPKDQSERNPRG